jgi:low affinity Fe/Cu permease
MKGRHACRVVSACPLNNFSSNWNIFMKIGISIMTLETIPLMCLRFGAISNTDMADVRTSR